MLSAQQRGYLKAMGIDVWLLRPHSVAGFNLSPLSSWLIHPLYHPLSSFTLIAAELDTQADLSAQKTLFEAIVKALGHVSVNEVRPTHLSLESACVSIMLTHLSINPPTGYVIPMTLTQMLKKPLLKQAFWQKLQSLSP